MNNMIGLTCDAVTAPLTSPVVKPEVNEFDDPMVEAADTACYGWTVMLALKLTLIY